MNKPRSNQRLSNIVTTVFNLLLAGGLMIWGVFNLTINGLAYSRSGDEQATWGIAILLVILTAAVPFGLGLWLLVSSTSRSKE